MNAEALPEFVQRHAPSLPTWVWVVIACVTLANAIGVAFAFLIVRRAIAAANDAKAYRDQAQLYHDPPLLRDAVEKAEKSAEVCKAMMAKWRDGTLGPILQFAGEDPTGTDAPERLVTALEKIAVTAVVASNRCNALLEEMESKMRNHDSGNDDPMRDAGLDGGEDGF